MPIYQNISSNIRWVRLTKYYTMLSKPKLTPHDLSVTDIICLYELYIIGSTSYQTARIWYKVYTHAICVRRQQTFSIYIYIVQ